MIKELSLKDKLEINQLIPKEGDLLTVGIIHDITKKVEITQGDIIEYDIKTLENAISWNERGKTVLFKIDFTEPELHILRAEIKKLNDSKKIPVSLYGLCIKLNKDE